MSRSPLRTFVEYLPKALRHKILRRLLKVSHAFPPELSFRLARTQEELEAAYRILHDSYVEMKYMQPHPSRLRLTKYFALPTTSTLIALWNDEIVGTLSIIRSSPFGLPLDQGFDISDFHKRGWQIAEVSSLAIKREFRFGRGQVLLPLCKFFYDYARFYMNLDAVVIAINPTWSDFYEGLLMFKPIHAPIVETYGFANGAPAVAKILPLKQSEIDFRTHYAHLPKRTNLYQFFVVNSLNPSWFPARTFSKSLDPVMTPQKLRYFFHQKSSILNELSPSERRHLCALYPDQEYSQVLGRSQIENVLPMSRQPRFVVDLHTREHRALRILNVSAEGLLISSTEGPLHQVAPTNVSIVVGPNMVSHLQVEPVWQNLILHQTGFRIVRSDSIWLEFIAFLDSDLKQLSVSKAA